MQNALLTYGLNGANYEGNRGRIRDIMRSKAALPRSSSFPTTQRIESNLSSEKLNLPKGFKSIPIYSCILQKIRHLRRAIYTQRSAKGLVRLFYSVWYDEKWYETQELHPRVTAKG